MAELTYRPVEHRHAAFLKKAGKRSGFKATYDALASEYAVANEMLAVRVRSGLIQEAVTSRKGISFRCKRP